MKRKYYAYWCKSNNHWAIKQFKNNGNFLEMVKCALEECYDIGGFIFPFEVEVKKGMGEPGNWIQFEDCPLDNPLAIGNHPALLHIKEMMQKTNWLKG